ncbi:MAG: thiamine phosphate synthase [Clostridia bacterium]|nr:thiamine phosphate synthase [Clostridia bacterium]
MKIEKEKLKLYAVTDRCGYEYGEFLKRVEAALQSGVTCLQLREKGLDYASFLSEALEVKALCKKHNVPFIINDNVDLALEIGADGVHVGQEDMRADDVRRKAGDKLIVGVSAHSVEEALAAEAAGADYLGCGAVFVTSTKSDVTPLGFETLREICSAVGIPVVAIGGINGYNITKLAGSGIDGVAVASAVFGAENVNSACGELKSLVEKVTDNG